MIEAEAEFLRRTYPQGDHAALHNWLKYFDARVRLNEGHNAEMEPVLRALRNQPGDDKFRSWVLSELGRCLHNLSKLHEALETYKQVVEPVERTRVDPWNTPSWQSAIADIYLSLDETLQAEQYCRAAIEKAEEVANSAKLVRSLTTLSGLLQGQGRLESPLTIWREGAALHNRGDIHVDLADWDKAMEDLVASRKLWQAMEHRNLIAFSTVAEAAVLRRRGLVCGSSRG